MAMIRSFGVALAVIILIVVATNSAAGQPTYSSILCNTQKMASGDPFVGTVTKLLCDYAVSDQVTRSDRNCYIRYKDYDFELGG